MPFSTIWTALFYPYIAHERTAQNLILSVRSVPFALCLKERHRSQNGGSLKSDWAISKSDVPSSGKYTNSSKTGCMEPICPITFATSRYVTLGHFSSVSSMDSSVLSTRFGKTEIVLDWKLNRKPFQSINRDGTQIHLDAPGTKPASSKSHWISTANLDKKLLRFRNNHAIVAVQVQRLPYRPTPYTYR